jgi:hypothetical protein
MNQSNNKNNPGNVPPPLGDDPNKKKINSIFIGFMVSSLYPF